ncbi:hypothetical protein I350_07472 [Cryptococcus amylolentus CBS 6273]|uniref:Ribosomal protein mS38 C-terminal domain-containing protein n=1 Tax=Cryptococcus amylolentus CBS 6273 TaxID=1296118 RepID=A0A1E3JGR1_9TREE|nr:hypothetical protein I350_07472 [Cryptococcus amylolentus CBS 6273]
MLLRRLYSTCPHGHASHHPPTPLPQTRGRTKPRLALPKPRSRHTTTISKPLPAITAGRGRKPRLSFSSHSGSSYPTVPEPAPAHIPRTPRLSYTHASPALNHTNEFTPIFLYPEQFKLHTAFTHPAYPLPLFNGTRGYTQPSPEEGENGGDIFRKPVAKAPKMGGGAMADHLNVVNSLPMASGQFAHGQVFGTPEMDGASITAFLENRAKDLARVNESEWNKVMAMMDGKLLSAQAEEQEKKKEVVKDISLDDVVGELEGMLAEMQVSQGDEVHMDSVKRKRRKKISKHKHKKRRKATRALRKRLGK